MSRSRRTSAGSGGGSCARTDATCATASRRIGLVFIACEHDTSGFLRNADEGIRDIERPVSPSAAAAGASGIMFVRMPRRRKTNPALSATGAGAAPPARGLEFLDDFSNPDLARYYEIVPGVGKFLAQSTAWRERERTVGQRRGGRAVG